MIAEDLRSFVTVIDEASLTRAANTLCVTQSAVSRRIQRLEESLGAELFDRNSKPPKATALAQRIYEYAVPLLRDLDRLLDVPAEHAAPAGTFRLGMTQAVADIVLFDAVIALKSAFPALDVRLHTDWSSGLQQQLAPGSLDAAVLLLPHGRPPAAGTAGRLITTLDVVVVQSRKKPLVKGRTAIRSLAAHTWVLNPHGCGYRAALERAMDDAGHSLRVGVDTHGTDMQLRLVAAGLGLGLVPRSVLQRSSPYRDLAVVNVNDFALQLDVWLVHPQQLGNLRRAVDLLADVATETLRKHDAVKRKRAGV
ncbi:MULTISPECIES: LysR family transcriptional regulator [Paraburkholderia]|uniref:LysR family transcriptional regulator n=1 Tax=Paraburkholderia TaxID=1822464 RepID=UPI00225A5C29|nr:MULTISPECIES: LysR family transcriptional regulator [Paraburkholderia]MCX4166264.1 LysR family transcriptional regulator [Paraburkholderia megapolitana]MDN7161754.1 LysR family transcriptional regulator [Paraburkholderia sp. CHISQ3]MDQ6498802.1 LysR family transcriptional regulator [Paraburkholderia megapolitana]